MATLTGVRPPSPPPAMLGGHILAMRRDPLAFLMRTARQYGDVVYITVPTFAFYLISHPADIEKVLVGDYRYFVKGKVVRSSLAGLGEGLLTSEGEFWLRQRRLMQPAFHRARVATYGQQMVAATERMLGGWQLGQTLDVQAAMMALTLEIVAEALFSAAMANAAQRVGQAIEAVLEFFTSRRALVLIPESWPTPRNRRNRAANETLDSIVYDIIRQRKAMGGDNGDLLSMLLAARDDDGGMMSDKQLRDEVMTLFLAGHETTAVTLTWALYLLAKHPAATANLDAELHAVLGGRPPTLADLPNLPYTAAVIDETLRLYPPAWRIGRETAQDVELGGYLIPKGSVVGLSQWVVQRDPRWFLQPNQFIPDRWLGGLAKRIPKYAYFPFGGGQRICIGQQFALMEANLVLATIVQRFRLHLTTAQDVAPWPSVTLRPRGGVQMRVENRK